MAKKKRTYAQTRKIYVEKLRMSPKQFEKLFGKKK